VEASLWVHSDFHHDSIGWELTRTLVDKAFEVSAMPLMLAASCQENRPAQRLLLSCGFTYHSIVPRPHEEGFPLPLFEYRQTHDEWLRTMETRVTELKPTASRAQDGARTPEAANRAAFKAVAGR
jgi:RimJ/RimL family protein N-acetyltransferase